MKSRATQDIIGGRTNTFCITVCIVSIAVGSVTVVWFSPVVVVSYPDASF
jgi:hypothetical protein